VLVGGDCAVLAICRLVRPWPTSIAISCSRQKRRCARGHPARVLHRSWAPLLCRTGAGLPLLITALLRDLVDTGRGDGPAPADGAWPLGVPDRLVDLTAERLARLDPAARRAVEITAVTGIGCSPAHLGRLGELVGAAGHRSTSANRKHDHLVRLPQLVNAHSRF